MSAETSPRVFRRRCGHRLRGRQFADDSAVWREIELASAMMQSGGTLTWLLVAASLSGVPVIQTASTLAVTPSGLSATTDNSDPWPTTAAQTTTMTTTDVEITEGRSAVRDGRFCNETISYALKTDCKPCTINAELGCPGGLIQLTQVLSHFQQGRSDGAK